jgi:hypothetical protein
MASRSVSRQTKPCAFLEQVARGTAERARIGAAGLGEFQREIEKTGIFRRGKSPAWLAAGCGQIQKNILRVAAGIFLDDSVPVRQRHEVQEVLRRVNARSAPRTGFLKRSPHARIALALRPFTSAYLSIQYYRPTADIKICAAAPYAAPR